MAELVAAFEAQGISLLTYVVEPGESTKCREVKEEIEDWLLSNLCNRDTCILALGGGVVGDLIGYDMHTMVGGAHKR